MADNQLTYDESLSSMRLPFFTMLICLAMLFAPQSFAATQDSTMQIILTAEMPNIADPTKTRYAELKQLILNERKRVPTTFFVFGGGSVGPSALSNLDRGSHIIDILNSLEPDAMGGRIVVTLLRSSLSYCC